MRATLPLSTSVRRAWQQRTGTGDFAVAIALDERNAASTMGGAQRCQASRRRGQAVAPHLRARRYRVKRPRRQRTAMPCCWNTWNGLTLPPCSANVPLFDDDCRLGAPDAREVRLPYSGKSLGVPPNLLILGTLDGAVALPPATDAALRRRFTFVELSPDPNALSQTPLGGPTTSTLPHC